MRDFRWRFTTKNYSQLAGSFQTRSRLQTREIWRAVTLAKLTVNGCVRTVPEAMPYATALAGFGY
jgi:hypothetical protein